MSEIQLNKNKICFIDNEDYNKVKSYKWSAVYKHRNWYAQTHITVRGKRSTLLMHRLIMGHFIGDIDHVDNNGLNNQKSNLRLCDDSLNQMNSRKRRNCSSRFKGVSWHKRVKKWSARIKFIDTIHNLGYFDDEVEAAKVYDEHAIKYFGKFANINFKDANYDR